jgi:hypothetical protein
VPLNVPTQGEKLIYGVQQDDPARCDAARPQRIVRWLTCQAIPLERELRLVMSCLGVRSAALGDPQGDVATYVIDHLDTKLRQT